MEITSQNTDVAYVGINPYLSIEQLNPQE